MMTMIRLYATTSILYVFLASDSVAQWSPFGDVIDVVVIDDCSKTSGEIARATPDGIFYCRSRAKIVDNQVSDASHFYFVQAHGQLAIRKQSMKLADC